jgi:hypothetical protein
MRTMIARFVFAFCVVWAPLHAQVTLATTRPSPFSDSGGAIFEGTITASIWADCVKTSDPSYFQYIDSSSTYEWIGCQYPWYWSRKGSVDASSGAGTHGLSPSIHTEVTTFGYNGYYIDYDTSALTVYCDRTFDEVEPTGGEC